MLPPFMVLTAHEPWPTLDAQHKLNTPARKSDKNLDQLFAKRFTVPKK